MKPIELYTGSGILKVSISEFIQFNKKQEIQRIEAIQLNLHCLPSLLDFTQLKYLDCSRNQLQELPLLPNSLKNLICSQNQITNLPSPLPPNLEILDCSMNQITELPVLDSVLELNCSRNMISKLQDRIKYSKMTRLICNKNKLSGSFDYLPSSLHYFDCSRNQITHLPNLPKTLKELVCNYNPLVMLPPFHHGLTHLHVCGLSLTTLPILPTTLKYLDCRFNEFKFLPCLPPSLEYLNCGQNLLSYHDLESYLQFQEPSFILVPLIESKTRLVQENQQEIQYSLKMLEYNLYQSTDYSFTFPLKCQHVLNNEKTIDKKDKIHTLNIQLGILKSKPYVHTNTTFISSSLTMCKICQTNYLYDFLDTDIQTKITNLNHYQTKIIHSLHLASFPFHRRIDILDLNSFRNRYHTFTDAFLFQYIKDLDREVEFASDLLQCIESGQVIRIHPRQLTSCCK